MHKISKEEILEYLRCLSAATGKDYSSVVRLIEDSIEKGFNLYKIKLINHIEPQFDCEVYRMRRKTPPFRAGDIRRVRRICVSN